MASAVFNVETLVEEAQDALNDITGNRMLENEKILSFLLRRVTTRNHSVTLYDCGDGNFAYLGGSDYPMLAPTFTGEDDLVYTVNGYGPSVVVTTGDASVDSIEVTGTLVDYGEALADMLVYLATHRSGEAAQSIGNGSYSPNQVHRQLMEMAEVLRGPRGA